MSIKQNIVPKGEFDFLMDKYNEDKLSADESRLLISILIIDKNTLEHKLALTPAH